jgi:hypothetical protein
MNSPSTDNPCPTCTIPCDARTIDGEAGCVTPTTDENRFVSKNGSVFIALDDARQSCTYCDLHSLYEICAEVIEKQGRASCHAEFRKDHRNIVWKREAGK